MKMKMTKIQWKRAPTDYNSKCKHAVHDPIA